MVNQLVNLAAERGDKLTVIPYERLQDIKETILSFGEQEELNGFTKWIIENIYKYEPENAGFTVRSVILVAIPKPFYANVNFSINGLRKTAIGFVKADIGRVEEYIKSFAEQNGYSILPATNLPYKRLGVLCGMAEYGRNNITYIEGFGSNFAYTAYFSDIMPENFNWFEVNNAELCNSCGLCITECPTGAIKEDRFLIDNQRCLSCLNEVPDEFPAWLPKEVHHTLYDCLICQKVCPMNQSQLDNIMEDINFSEEETLMLLEGKDISTFPKELSEKVDILGLAECYEAIPRNLSILLEK